MRIVFLMLTIALFAGCKPTPKALARKIADTDHIIARYWQPSHKAPPEISNFSVTITGDDVQKIVRAVSRSTSGGMQTLCSPEWELQFYKGTNRLAAVGFSCDRIWVDGDEFVDASGTLGKLGRAIEAQANRRPTPTNGTIAPLPTY